MNILLSCQYYYPSIGGAQEAIKQIGEGLVNLGHSVTIATSFDPQRKTKTVNGVQIKDFAISGSEVKGCTGDTKAYQDFLIHSDFDIMLNYAAQQWSTDLVFPIIDKIKAKKVLVPCGYSGLHNNNYKAYFQKLPEILKKYDATVYLSNTYQDIIFARIHKLKNIHLIPNGASKTEFLNHKKLFIRKKLKIPSNHFLICHIGSHTRLKGHNELLTIFNKAKLKNTTLLVIGNTVLNGCQNSCYFRKTISNITPQNIINKKRVVMASLSREETISVLEESDLFLFPSNVECSPIVLFECLAAKVPFLATDVGNIKEIIAWSGSGDLLPTKSRQDTYKEAKIIPSAKLLEKLHNNKKLRNKMVKSGYDAWLKKFTWEKIAKQYEKLFLSLGQKI
ncbi:glycosyltransferase family 4 protein [Candidatus Beckwithbacteria bacterium]|nr:glycosyltransferase family 4 protein [Candidatus Beckwithbacteria bacterium]